MGAEAKLVKMPKEKKMTDDQKKEVKIAMQALGFEPTTEEVAKMVKDIDIDGNAPVEEMKKAFALYDADGKGKIVVADMIRVAKELGENLSKEELQGILDESDRDGNGTLTEDEFVRVMRNQQLI